MDFKQWLEGKKILFHRSIGPGELHVDPSVKSLKYVMKPKTKEDTEDKVQLDSDDTKVHSPNSLATTLVQGKSNA